MKDNPVAKNAHKFNKASVQKDRKKAEKKGDRKHKGKYQEDTDVVEDKKGLWDRIHAKRKRGEAPAKPGDKDYPKTLDIESKNTPDDGNPCWDTHKKVGTKMKGGKRVNDCVPKSESTAAYGKSQSSIRDKKKNAGISSSDKNKLGKLSALMSKEKESEMSKRMKRGQRNDPLNKIRAKRNEEVEQVDEEMSATEKRKHLNLKKRAKQGNSQAKIRLKKFEQQHKDELEGDKRSAKQSTKAIKGKGAADPHSGQAFTGKGSGAGDDDNLVSQLRKAQDVDGNLDIRLPAGNKTARLPKAIIDKLLAGYDRLQKPEDKKKFKVLLTKELRKKAK